MYEDLSIHKGIPLLHALIQRKSFVGCIAGGGLRDSLIPRPQNKGEFYFVWVFFPTEKSVCLNVAYGELLYPAN